MVRASAPLLCAVAGALCLLGPAAARADGRTDVRFDAHATFGWYRDFGGGLRVDIPVVTDGLVDGADDDLRISLGAEALWFFHDHGFGFYPLAALQWNFYLSEKWSIFPEAGFVVLLGGHRHDYFPAFVAPLVSFGARYHFNARNALLFRITWPHGGQVGIVF